MHVSCNGLNYTVDDSMISPHVYLPGKNFIISQKDISLIRSFPVCFLEKCKTVFFLASRVVSLSVLFVFLAAFLHESSCVRKLGKQLLKDISLLGYTIFKFQDNIQTIDGLVTKMISCGSPYFIEKKEWILIDYFTKTSLENPLTPRQFLAVILAKTVRNDTLENLKAIKKECLEKMRENNMILYENPKKNPNAFSENIKLKNEIANINTITKETIEDHKKNAIALVRQLSELNGFIEIDILNGIQQGNSLFERALERFSS